MADQEKAPIWYFNPNSINPTYFSISNEGKSIELNNGHYYCIECLPKLTEEENEIIFRIDQLSADVCFGVVNKMSGTNWNTNQPRYWTADGRICDGNNGPIKSLYSYGKTNDIIKISINSKQQMDVFLNGDLVSTCQLYLEGDCYFYVSCKNPGDKVTILSHE